MKIIYIGSKTRIAKHLLPILLQNRKQDQWYIEPFVGGANVIDKVNGNRLGNDSHYYLIAMWQALQQGWQPPTQVSREMYHDVKAKQMQHSAALVGFVGFLCSFGSKWWGGYAKNNQKRNYADTGARGLLKQIDNLRDVVFTNVQYWQIPLPYNSLIYCDPPYEGTTGYQDKFDHKKFWNWVREKDREGHTIFVSEYQAPDDFDCLMEVEHKVILTKNSDNHKKYNKIERLYRNKKLKSEI